MRQVLPALGGLVRLQRCSIGATGEGSIVPLPMDAWLDNLQWLHCNMETLVQSVEQLTAATQLEYLSVSGSTSRVAAHHPDTEAFWNWVA